jgi:hypothetical protein
MEVSVSFPLSLYCGTWLKTQIITVDINFLQMI